MAQANRLIDSQLKALKADPDKDVWANDGNGLYIRARPNGTKSWVLRRKINRRPKRTKLGEYPQMALKTARIEAARIRSGDQETADISDAEAPALFRKLVDRYYQKHTEPNYRRRQQVRQYIDNLDANDLKALQFVDLTGKETQDFRVAIHAWLRNYGTAIGYLTVEPLQELTRKLVGG
jgi:hypothetical protein